jgi:hypothetical protein
LYTFANKAFSAVFQAGGLVVVLVEVSRKPYLASIVPVIVNAILNEHQIIVDIVAFVNRGDFPRSRLGEKQRGKILAGWVTRKMRTLAQFAIRDLDPSALGDGEGDPNRASSGSGRSTGIPTAGSSSLRNVEHAPQILEQEEFEKEMDHIAGMAPAAVPMGMGDDQATPTEKDYNQQQSEMFPSVGIQRASAQGEEPDTFDRFSTMNERPSSRGFRHADGQKPPQIQLPSVDGRESMVLWNDDDEQAENSEDWKTDAIMHMNLTGQR